MLLMRWMVVLGVAGCVCMQSVAQESPMEDAPGAHERPVALVEEQRQGQAEQQRGQGLAVAEQQQVQEATAAEQQRGQGLAAVEQQRGQGLAAVEQQRGQGVAAAEQQEGTVRGAFVAPEQAVAEALQGVLRGYRFNKRLLAQSPQDNWLLFTRGPTEVALVGWTERRGTEEELLALAPATPMYFGLYRYSGEQIQQIPTVGSEIGMVLEREPKILLPSAANGLLMLAANAETMPAVMRVQGPRLLELTCEFRNPLDEIAVMPVPDMAKTIALRPGGSTTIRKEIEVGRSSQPIHTSIGAMGIRQPVTIVVENPLELVVRPEEPQMLMLDIVNTGGQELKGEVLLTLENSAKPFRLPLEFRQGQRLHSMRIPLGTALPLPAPMVVSVEQTLSQPMRRTFTLGQTGALQFAPTANFSRKRADGSPEAYRVEYSGGASALVRGGLPAGTGVPWPAYGALGVVYDLGAAPAGGDAQIDVVPTDEWAQQVYANPKQIGFWLQGDDSGNLVSLVWSDAQGREYVSEEHVIDWRGWRYVLFDLPAGAQIDYPLRWDSLLSLRRGGEASAQQGALLANGFCFIYGDNFSTVQSEPSHVQYERSVTVPVPPIEISEPQIIHGKPLQRGGGGAGGRN